MLLITYGTRPEWIKIKPIVKLLDKLSSKYILLFTGQHQTLINEKYDKKIFIPNCPGDRLNIIVKSILDRDDIFENVDKVLVQGDTASAFAIALSSFHKKIPVIHLEAGLRSYDVDNPYPEEFYRRCISNLASVHLCPTYQNKNNLEIEKVRGKIFVVGNTSIDSLVSYKNMVKSGGGCLITLHRRENAIIMQDWITELNNISKQYNMSFKIIQHPNLNLNTLKNTENLQVLNPLPHSEMLKLIVECDVIISDSGGLQEEASYFKKPIIVCRKVTERPESIGITSFMCNSPKNLKSVFEKTINIKIENIECPFGDGMSAEKIVKILNTI